jgi:uncharacterized delta-60 repeat protein
MAVALAASGVAVGSSARPGALDVGFGKGGKVVTAIGPRLNAAAVARAPAGGVYVAANTGAAGANIYGGRLVLFRYDRRGRLVGRFGSGGASTHSLPFGPAAAEGLAVQPDGRPVLVGSVGGRYAQDLLAVRFNRDGSLDRSFGVAGVQRTDLGGLIEGAADVAIQPDGALVVAGSVDIKFPAMGTFGELVVIRYRPDGSLDTGFGTGGVVRRSGPDGGYANGQAVEVLPDGSILVGGNEGIVHRDTNFPIVVRLRADGSVDTGVGMNGVAYLAVGTRHLRDMAFDPRRGLAYVAGSERDDAGGGGDSFFVAALRPELVPALDFGRMGVARAEFARSPLSIANALALDRRGRIVLAGTAARLLDPFGQPPPRGRFALARFRSDGRLDRGFGRRGRMRVGFGRGWSLARAVVVQPGGRILAVGNNVQSEIADTGPAVTLARFIG